MRLRFLALGVAVVVAGAGCSSGGHRATAPTIPVPSTADAPNPDVIPPVITPAYVNAVFAVLNHINGNAARLSIASNEITPTVMQDLRAIYGAELYTVEIRVFQEGLIQGRANLRSPMGDRITTVISLISTSPTCIFVQTRTDLSQVEIRPALFSGSEYWELQHKTPTQDPAGVNPTPWALTFNRDFESPTEMSSPCSA